MGSSDRQDRRKPVLWLPILLGVIAVSIYLGTLIYHALN